MRKKKKSFYHRSLLPFLGCPCLILPWGCVCLFHSFVTLVSPPSASGWSKHPCCSPQARPAPSPGNSWTTAYLCLNWCSEFMLMVGNNLFFHTVSYYPDFKVIIFCHTLILLSSYCQQSLSHQHISLAYLELLKNTDLVSRRYEA